MNCLLALICLVGLLSVTQSDATDPLVIDYIDTNRNMGLFENYLAAVGDIMNKHGSKDPEENVQLLIGLKKAVDSESPEALDKFGLENQTGEDIFGVGTAAQYLINFHDHRCDKFTIQALLMAIIHFFDRDLNSFSRKEDLVDGTNMRAFLHLYGREELIACLPSATNSNTLSGLEAESDYAELKMDQMVANGRDLVAGEEEAMLISEAKHLDLVKGKFDARAMLDAVDTYKDPYAKSGVRAHKRLSRQLEHSCHWIQALYGHRLDIYNLARFVMLNEVDKYPVSRRFLKLNEYARVCIPTWHPELADTIEKNIKCNLGSSLSACFRK